MRRFISYFLYTILLIFLKISSANAGGMSEEDEIEYNKIISQQEAENHREINKKHSHPQEGKNIKLQSPPNNLKDNNIKQIYFNLLGGVNHSSIDRLSRNINASSAWMEMVNQPDNNQMASIMSGAIGYRFSKLPLNIDISYDHLFKTQFKKAPAYIQSFSWANDLSYKQSIQGHLLMANFSTYLQEKWGFKPYFGIGIGAMHYKAQLRLHKYDSNHSDPNYTLTKTHHGVTFAQNAFIGTSYQLTDRVSLLGQLKYIHINGMKNGSNDTEAFKISAVHNLAVMGGVQLDFSPAKTNNLAENDDSSYQLNNNLLKTKSSYPVYLNFLLGGNFSFLQNLSRYIGPSEDEAMLLVNQPRGPKFAGISEASIGYKFTNYPVSIELSHSYLSRAKHKRSPTFIQSTGLPDNPGYTQTISAHLLMANLVGYPQPIGKFQPYFGVGFGDALYTLKLKLRFNVGHEIKNRNAHTPAQSIFFGTQYKLNDNFSILTQARYIHLNKMRNGTDSADAFKIAGAHNLALMAGVQFNL